MQASEAVPDYRRQRQIVRERLRARKRQGRKRPWVFLPPPRARAAVLLCVGLALMAFAAYRLRLAASVSPPPRLSVSPSPRLSAGPAPTGSPFTLVMNGATPSVELSEALRRAIRRQWPGYRLPPAAAIQGEALEEMRQEHPDARTPYAITGDFNGDGRFDAALLLRRGRRGMLAAFQATSDGRYDGRRLLRTPWSDGIYIVRQAAGPVDCNRYQDGVPVGTETVLLRADAIRFSPVDAAPQVHYFEGDRYRQVEVGE